ncbi:hypothetical protein COY25_03865 [Candidatus Uhrbacteria bacterium CG_4_10_14_0_2_um_filter_41_7]|uniref:Uncharacterized protein n=1 Tax=Candidatus Uhrbacteria bacterium CG_4_9_14_3_um_filter_41_35 TaxID=1975034 RepID=A0A2M7XG87_9BACT|nr:MAG: hypothetical protein COY25_03865 [Candidatus Uhrbacteria bacterium CG_4_10_14_0_2_um_filter_41_7]PJA46888.1 MAG: hypothetical protein CO173_00655 [Candidatus Uhrbacteria bacterium CG_4_9_14_3_um_filter_41_35]
MENEKRERIVIRKTKPEVSKEQKAGFALVLITSVMSIVLGGFYMSRHLASPFDFEYVGPRFLSVAEQRAEELSTQKNSDTDEDGLSDYDELYTYHTSPYLKDTDGDGVSDPEEIKAGTDPNCLSDSCGADANSAFENAGNQLLENLPPLDPSIQQTIEGGLPEATPGDVSALEGMTAPDIRQLLLDNGATADQVDALSDDEIMVLYNDVLANLETSTTTQN